MTTDFHEAWRTATPAPPRRPTAPADTPIGAEERLESYRDALDKAAEMLADARNDELKAKEARNAARRQARFSDECPKVGVFGGVRTTVDYQKEWIAAQIEDEEHAYELAKTTRQAASEHLRTLKEQGRFQQSLTAVVREQYRGTNGRYGP